MWNLKKEANSFIFKAETDLDKTNMITTVEGVGEG